MSLDFLIANLIKYFIQFGLRKILQIPIRTYIVFVAKLTVVDLERQSAYVWIFMLLQTLDVLETIEFLNNVDSVPKFGMQTERYHNLVQCIECVLE